MMPVRIQLTVKPGGLGGHTVKVLADFQDFILELLASQSPLLIGLSFENNSMVI